MLEGKAVMGETDMKQTMKEDALSLAAKALDCFDVTEPTQIARFIKKCIAGTHFGSFLTHCSGCFIHFSVGNLTILLFKGSAGEVASGPTV
ncbi:hypothetical protein DY000_02038563 [Brassica cretica]|uniref:Dynein light chain n=1 Tax=Brassica cretica TaxID=69181 RepID=A0ABQ7BRD7_BRACR|nr:hypothetical protein DY000_02038563 [Brassica cretica]